MPNSARRVAVDTGLFVGLLCSNDGSHQICLQALRELPEITAFATTESCLVESSFLLPPDPKFLLGLQRLIETMDIEIVPLTRQGLIRVCELMSKYKDLPMDFADATLVVACEDLDIRQVLTLDRRDFSLYKPRHSKGFRLLPSL